MGPENFEAHRRKKPLIGHAGKHETVDMSVNPDTVTGPLDPEKTLEDMRLLRGIRRRAMGRRRKKF